MSADFWFSNLAAYWLQIAAMAAAGFILSAASRLRTPRAIHAYWQALLGACLILPLIQPWQPMTTASVQMFEINAIHHTGGQAASRILAWPSSRLALIVLVAGVLLRLAWLAAAYARLRMSLASAPALEPCAEFTRELSARLGVRAQFRQVANLGSPATFGIRHPLILLPARFEELTPKQQQAVLAHELLHAARHDWAFNLAEEIVLALFWFHPGVWWLVRRVRLSREQVVDREVVRLVGVRRDYMDALLEIAAHAQSPALAAAPFLNESQLAERIRMLVKEDAMSKRKVVLTLSALAALTLAAGLAAVRVFPLSAPPAAAPEESQTAGNPPLKIVKKIQPVYPPAAKMARVQGKVVLQCTISKEGRVLDVEVLKGDPLLVDSATSTVKQWIFAPLENGQAITKIEINYTLADKKPASSANPGEAEDIAKASDKGVVGPVAIYHPEPPYTPEARAAKVQGTVDLHVTINSDGTVRNVEVVKSLDKGLDQNAADTVKTWKFKPATKDGKPIPVKATIEVAFKVY